LDFAAFALQQVAPPPGAQPQAGTAPPPPAGPPPGAEPPGMGLGFMLLMMLPLLFIMFWLPRSQQKKQAAAIGALKKGDRVLTQAGLVGKLVEIGDRYAKVEVAPGVSVQVLRSSLAGRDEPPAAKAAQLAAADKPADKKS
jgi:preprotein translocase subunit YajC